MCNTPNIWASYFYIGAPRYLVAFLILLAASAGAVIMAFVTRMYLAKQNKKLDNGEDTGKNGPTAAQIASGFRYTL